MKTNHLLPAFLFAFLAGICQLFAQGTTAFTYQGRLLDNGTGVNGVRTMIFALYDSETGGNLICPAVTTNTTLANGLFTVNLDFGANAFHGSACWLDITIANGGTTQTLSPRVQVLSVPHAQYATLAAGIASTAETTAGSKVVSSDTWSINPSQNTSHALVITDNGHAQAILKTNGQGVLFPYNVQSAGKFVGNGSGLTNLSFTLPNVVVFTKTGSFSVPAGVSRIMVEIWGAGGGGGSGSFNNKFLLAGGGGGGGAGGYVWGIFSVDEGTLYTVTVGVSNPGQPGTATSFGGLLTATGGSAGGNAVLEASGSNVVSAVGGPGGIGGIGSGGQINISGGSGQSGGQGGIAGGLFNGGIGGSVWRGGLAGPAPGAFPANGGPSTGGAGGTPSQAAASTPGFAGSSGMVIITY